MIVAEVRRRFIAAEFQKRKFVATRFIALNGDIQENRQHREILALSDEHPQAPQAAQLRKTQ